MSMQQILGWQGQMWQFLFPIKAKSHQNMSEFQANKNFQLINDIKTSVTPLK